ncbi:MAG: hypothetical protein EOO07_38040, partial [Chitinophagaceae bacterium]
MIAYYSFVLPWVNRTLSEQYYQQTGHQLQHDKISVQLLNCSFTLSHLKDSSSLWQAEDVHVTMGCMQSFRERGLFINDITIRKLVANIHQLDNSQWNFNDILVHQQKIQKASPEKSSNKNIPIVIKKITLSDAALHSNLLVLNNLTLD